MKKFKNILLIGLGAIGSIYATKFHNSAEASVKILLDESRLERYKKDGINFNGIRYDFNYVLPSETAFKADLILIATKSNDFLNAVEMIKNFVKEDTIILSLLNGISTEPILIEKFGNKKVLYSYFIGHASMKQGVVVTHDGVGTIVFGELKNTEYSRNVLMVKELFEKVNIDYKIPEDMLSSMWQKFVINIGINQTSALLKADYRKLQESEEAEKMLVDLMTEAVKIAQIIGVNNTEDFLSNCLELVKKMPTNAKSSMLQDVENNRQTEVDIFAGEIIRLGKTHGISTPNNELAYKKIKEI